MELGFGDHTAWRPHCPWPNRQPALWPTLAALALLSSVTEASLDPAPRSPAAREGPAPVLAPPTGPLPGRGTLGALVRQRKNPAAAATVSATCATAARVPAAVTARGPPRGPRGARGAPGGPAGGGGGAELPPALAAGAGARARPGPQLGRAGAVPLLQRLLPPRALPARPEPGQPAGRRRPAAAPRLPAAQPALLPAHSLRGRLLHGREQHLEDRGPPFRHRLRLPGLRTRAPPASLPGLGSRLPRAIS
ncbi:artemin isoform X2 [Perognathus longimembris pacificus]|nr:artemin isoform X2 [Perognathus longimembris pacificus]